MTFWTIALDEGISDSVSSLVTKSVMVVDRSDECDAAVGVEKLFWQALMMVALLRIGYILLLDPGSVGEIIVYGGVIAVSVGRLRGWLSKYTR